MTFSHTMIQISVIGTLALGSDGNVQNPHILLFQIWVQKYQELQETLPLCSYNLFFSIKSSNALISHIIQGKRMIIWFQVHFCHWSLWQLWEWQQCQPAAVVSTANKGTKSSAEISVLIVHMKHSDHKTVTSGHCIFFQTDLNQDTERKAETLTELDKNKSRGLWRENCILGKKYIEGKKLNK